MSVEPSAEALRVFIRQNYQSLLHIQNVNSVGIGYKVKGGVSTGKKCVSFTVGQKTALESLEEGMSVPPTYTIDGIVVKTDVIQRSFKSHAIVVQIETQIALADRRKVFSDPVVPGVSISRDGGPISAGTVGCIVYDAMTGQPYILSNWHVLHCNDDVTGGKVVQPGLIDYNNSQKTGVGKLIRSYLGKAGDCAIASVEGRNFSPEILDLKVCVERIGEPELGDIVVKSGRTTGVTYGKVTRVDVVTSMDYGAGNAQAIGCFEIGIDPDHKPSDGEISKPGDSGSAWMFVENVQPSNMILGLHFAGNTKGQDEVALACYATSVFEKLNIYPKKPVKAETEEITKGLGYDPSFLGVDVPNPTMLSADEENDVNEKDNIKVFNYTHYSLSMNKSRKFAHWVAWNIDGGAMMRLSRSNMKFRFDQRLDEEAQVGDELYKSNNIDRGHIARRADLCWGTQIEAENANRDSFYFTNITPQHADFNQPKEGTGLWGQLEEGIFDDYTVSNLKVSVMGGPIFDNDDPDYRGVKIPTQFWKIIYYKEEGSDKLNAKGFVLSQKNLMDKLEVLELPKFRLYESQIAEIGKMTGLTFSNPQVAAPESLESPHELIESLDQIKW